MSQTRLVRVRVRVRWRSWYILTLIKNCDDPKCVRSHHQAPSSFRAKSPSRPPPFHREINSKPRTGGVPFGSHRSNFEGGFVSFLPIGAFARANRTQSSSHCFHAVSCFFMRAPRSPDRLETVPASSRNRPFRLRDKHLCFRSRFRHGMS